MKINVRLIFLALLLATVSVGAQTPTKLPSDSQRTQWFRDAGFGMFIHWGLYSVPAGVWDGKPIGDKRYVNPLAEHIMMLERIPLKRYAKLAEGFDPKAFDAEAIVRMAKDAGAKYITFTTKHHDGFAMYDSKVSPYNIVRATPYAKDPLKALAEACKRQGIRLALYYSLGRDWEDPNAVANEPRRNTWDYPDKAGLSYQKYLDDKVKPQLRELLTNYGEIALVWFDTPELTTPAQSLALQSLVREIQPNCLINTRVGNDVGDIIEMGDNQIAERAGAKPWESPATMAESWGYSVLDTKEYWKSSNELIEKLVESRSKGGNYLLNVGPDGLGNIPELARTRMNDIAAWMAVNGEAVHRTEPVATKIYNAYLTQNATHIFVFVKRSAEKYLLMYVDPKTVGKITLLTPAGERPVAFKRSAGTGLVIETPKNLPFASLSVLRTEKTGVAPAKLKIPD